MKISILTATRDRAVTLGAALDSLDAQSFTTWQHLVQDGGSDVATRNLLDQRRDPRRSVVRVPDSGVYDALNKAQARASGDVIGVLHSDDVFHSKRVLDLVAKAFADPGVGAVYGNLDYVSANEPGHVCRRWRAGAFSPSALRRGWTPPHPALFVRRATLDRVGPFDPGFAVSADYDQMLRLFCLPDLRVRYIPQTLVTMRARGLSNGSGPKIARRMREDLQVLRKNGMGGPGTLALKMLRKLPQFVT